MGKIEKLLAAAVIAASLSACGVGADEESSSGTGSAGASEAAIKAALQKCSDTKYAGTETDPQVYTFDYIAQFDRCALAATGDSRYKTDGDNQCRVLSAFIRDTGSSFRPLNCVGAVLRS